MVLAISASFSQVGPQIAITKEVIIKITAKPVVNLDISVAPPRSPNNVEEAPPPNAPAKPSPLSAWKRTITIKAIQTRR